MEMISVLGFRIFMQKRTFKLKQNRCFSIKKCKKLNYRRKIKKKINSMARYLCMKYFVFFNDTSRIIIVGICGGILSPYGVQVNIN